MKIDRLTDEDVPTGQDVEEGVQVVRVSAVEVVQELPGGSTRGSGKDLKTGLGRTIASEFTSNDED